MILDALSLKLKRKARREHGVKDERQRPFCASAPSVRQAPFSSLSCVQRSA